MIETTEQATAVQAAAAVSPRGAAVAIGLMSFSALLLELGLTRLFSVVLFYHFAFLAISIALLGLGAGAVFAYLRREWLERWGVGQLGAWLCAANAVVIFVVLEIVLRTAVSLHLDWSNFRHLSVLYLASADRKSTRLNSSHLGISYAVFCLKKNTSIPRRWNRGGSFSLPTLPATPARSD